MQLCNIIAPIQTKQTMRKLSLQVAQVLDEIQAQSNSIAEIMKKNDDTLADNSKEIEELKEKVEELEEQAEENTTQLFLFAEFLRCSDQELILAKFCADLEEFGDVALISLLRLITLICQMVFQGCRTSLKMY